jgi:hypothetical protein
MSRLLCFWYYSSIQGARNTMNGRSLAIFMCALTVAVLASRDNTYAASSKACNAFARDYARNASRQGYVVRRGLLGGIVGGVATGGAAAGVAVGTGVGLFSGDRKRQRQAEKIYRAAYRDCMAGRIR